MRLKAVPRDRASVRGFGLALLLSYAFLGATALQKVSDMNSMLFRGPILESALAGSIWSTKLGLNLIAFFLAIGALHAAFAWVCWLLARASLIAWPRANATLRQWLLLWFLLGVFSTSLASAGLFPPTALGQHYGRIADFEVLGVSLYTLVAAATVIAASVTVLRALAAWLRKTDTHHVTRQRGIFIGTAAATAAIVASAAMPMGSGDVGLKARVEQTRPHVILIGIDSLRADIVSPNRSSRYTPRINEFLEKSVYFSDALTPLARTFPSWVTLLTGRHPHTTGAFVNLLPRSRVHTKGTLADMLRAEGYRTVYAIDEVRFSNIDESYGFDETITPPIGATEFVLTFFADTPLLNLSVNSPVGPLLFPHLHGNRGAATFYDPDAFVRRIDSRVDSKDPLFLAVHLTLSHWPYHWAGTERPTALPHDKVPDFYLDAVHRTDQQFGLLMQQLQRKGLLDNAIVVLFSDHGESFGTASDSMVPIDSSEIVRIGAIPRWGHGTSVLSAHQYRTVLAMRRFSRDTAQTLVPKVISAPVTLEDVTPTIVDWLGLRPQAPFDGRSLRAALEGTSGEASDARRLRFTETEFNPLVIASITGKVHTSNAAAAARYYRVDARTDRVELRSEYIEWLRHMRQFAAIGETRLLAAIPSAVDARFVRLIVPLKGGLPARLEARPDAASDPEAAGLWDALEQRFGEVLRRGARFAPEEEPRVGAAVRQELTQRVTG